ncbi:MAG: AmmeMemoRadiSam system protein B [Candidatus Hydrogenedentes bacterium]|nr:AmmeMemoRadiSam system protein B [Candidatus Hydrogenedentota bacterium]
MSAISPLRAIDTHPCEQNGEKFIVITDPSGYVEEQLMLSPVAFVIALSLDGKRDAADVQALIQSQYNAELPLSAIEHVTAYLDKHGFLVSPLFFEKQKIVEDAYKASPIRPAYIAGRGYPEAPETLRTFIDACFTRKGGPGALPTLGPEDAPPQRCLIVPHIDFHRGGHSYAHGYGCMAGKGRPHTVFVFGVAHAAPPAPFILTKKAFETPLGTLQVNEAMVDALAGVCSWDPFRYESTHRTEHSIEFQAVMLAYLYGSSVQIVPILCACLDEHDAGTPPEHLAAVSRFLDRCEELAADPAHRVTVIAGADLAHVGKRFGDPFDIDDLVIQEVASRDEEDLDHVLRGDADGWYASVMKDDNERKVCGLGCIYAALRTAGSPAAPEGLLHYGYAEDPAGGIVSFASIGLG